MKSIGVNGHHLSEKLRICAEEGLPSGLSLTFSHEETILGTGGALRGFNAADSLLMNGDIYFDMNLQPLFKEFYDTKPLAALGVLSLPEKSCYSSVKIESGGRIRAIGGKREENDYFYCGIAMISEKLMKSIKPGFSDLIAHHLMPAIKEGLIVLGVPLEGLWLDLGNKETFIKNSFLALQRIKNGEMKIDNQQGHLLNGSLISHDAEIGDSVIFEKPSIIGKNSKIENGTVLDGAIVFPGTHVKKGGKVSGIVLS